MKRLKVNFKDTMLKKKGYYGNYDDLDALFNYSKSNADHRIYTEVKQRLQEIKDRHIYENLESQLSKMSVKDKKSGA